MYQPLARTRAPAVSRSSFSSRYAASRSRKGTCSTLDAGEDVVVTNVVLFLVVSRCQHQTNAAGREVDELSPDQGRHVQTVMRPVQGHRTSCGRVVKYDVE